MPDGLYETDALAWAERQAALLRRLAAGEGVNEAIDWPNVIEEVQDVGLSELRACCSLLQQAMTHLLKVHAWPNSHSAAAWSDEIGVFLDDAEQRFSLSMQQRIDLDALYAKARRRVGAAQDDSGKPRPYPVECPFAVAELLGGDVPALSAKLKPD